MGFLDRLRDESLTNPNPNVNFGNQLGGGPVNLGVSPSNSLEGTLNTIEPFAIRARNREMDDAKNMMLFQKIHGGMPSVQDGRIRQLSDPNNPTDTSQMNTVLAPGITDYQKASLGQGQQEIDLNKAKFGESKKTGDEKLALQEGAAKLNELKNEQIYSTRQKELEQKATEAEAKLKLSYDQLANNHNSAEMTANYHAAQIAAQNARHEADLALAQGKAADSERVNAARIKDLEDQIAGRNAPKTEEETLKTDKDGNVIGKTTTTSRGSTTSNAPKAPAGWKYIPKTGGGWTAVADSGAK